MTALAQQTKNSLHTALGNRGASNEVESALKVANSGVGGPDSVAFTIGTEAADVINVGVQLNDEDGNALAVRAGLDYYLSDDSSGDDLTGTAPDGGIAIGTDGLLVESVANKAGKLISESDGDCDVDITESGTATWYLVVVLPSGKLSVSGAITHAA